MAAVAAPLGTFPDSIVAGADQGTALALAGRIDIQACVTAGGVVASVVGCANEDSIDAHGYSGSERSKPLLGVVVVYTSVLPRGKEPEDPRHSGVDQGDC